MTQILNIFFYSDPGMLPKYSLTGTYYAEGKTRYNGTVQEGIWCENDVVLTSMRRDYIASTLIRHYVASTLIRRHFRTKCPLGVHHFFASNLRRETISTVLTKDRRFCVHLVGKKQM